MKSARIFLALAAMICAAATALPCGAATAATATSSQAALDPAATAIRARASAARVAGEQIKAGASLARFYAARAYSPAWTAGGKPSKEASQMQSAIERASEHALDPHWYHSLKIAEFMNGQAGADEDESMRAMAELDILLTDAFMTLGSNLALGLSSPYNFRIDWFKSDGGLDFAAILENALASRDVGRSLDSLAPQGDSYARLKKTIVRYDELAAKGGWSSALSGEKMEPGASDPRIVEIRRRLEAEGISAKPSGEDETIYDDALKDAVVSFQERHGLTPDGIIGRGSFAAMNASASWRACQARINLDRMRGLAGDFSAPKYISVNVPDYRVRVMEGGREALAMRAIVGRRDLKTPMMSNKVRIIVFSPRWDVPVSIAVKDELPKIKKDPSVLARKGMKIYSEGVEVPPEDVDWTAVDASNFSYHIVQRSGDDNALGRVKFLFPNKDNVYLHDTPNKSLFNNGVRTLSHGCVRIENPVDLAEYLLKGREEWNRGRIEAAMNRADPIYVNLDEPVPIHIVYVTAWAVEDGSPQFRDDVYGRDRSLEKQFCSAR